jgi:hypothetical protein
MLNEHVSRQPLRRIKRQRGLTVAVIDSISVLDDLYSIMFNNHFFILLAPIVDGR